MQSEFIGCVDALAIFSRGFRDAFRVMIRGNGGVPLVIVRGAEVDALTILARVVARDEASVWETPDNPTRRGESVSVRIPATMTADVVWRIVALVGEALIAEA